MKLFKVILFITVVLLFELKLHASPFSQQVSLNNWYVGDTRAGEWIKFKKVWLSEGTYRFTTRAIAGRNNQTIHLELNDQVIKPDVLVPTNEKDTFMLVHLGSKFIQAGYYDIKLVFETGNVNCDMIFVRKSELTEEGVLTEDTKYELNFEDGLKIFAIGGHANSTRNMLNGTDPGADAVWRDPNGNLFSRSQVLAWNKQCFYNFNLPYTQETTDIYIQELVESKTQVVFAHGRGEPDNTKDISDRSYQTGPGGMPCAALKYLVEGIRRSPYAKDQMKIAYFVDNAPFHLAIQKYLGVDRLVWGNKTHQEFIWNYGVKKFYENVPREMLYFTNDGKVPMQWWTANSHVSYPASGYQIKEFFDFIGQKMKEVFDLDVAFILSTSFFDRDPRTKDLAWGVQSWFSWSNLDVRTQITTHKNKQFAFALNGGRKPMKDNVLNDWNPKTNTGTWVGTDAHIKANYDDGIPKMRAVYQESYAQKAEWLVLEAWGDWREGSTWYRSHHPEYVFPNQYIALTREFADPNSGSIVLEAEACDEYNSTTVGNSGGAYRLEWYNDLFSDKEFWDLNMETNINVFRPLHKLSDIILQHHQRDKINLKQIATGLKDVWAIGTDEKVYANEVDGDPVQLWERSSQLQVAKDITTGGATVWVINTVGSLLSAKLSDGQDFNVSSNWELKNTPVKIVDIEATQAVLWGVDEDCKVYYRDLGGIRPWTQVAGSLKSITADESFVWGITPDGEIAMMSAQQKENWKIINNPYQLVKLSAGNYEVWGVNAKNEVYRMSSSGFGNWEYVNSGFAGVSVGIDYVWLIDVNGKSYKYEMSGFDNKTAFNRNQLTSIYENNRTFRNSIQVKQNPFRDYLNIEINCSAESSAVIRISDLSGVMLKVVQTKLTPGKNTLNMDGLGNLLSGVYILTVSEGENVFTSRIVKI